MSHLRDYKVGIAGFGNVGREVAKRLTATPIPGIRLVAATARDLDRARAAADEIDPALDIVPLAALPERCEVVVESATAESFREIAQTVLAGGCYLIAVSAGGLPMCPDIEELARRHGGRVRLATGGLPGFDILRCAAEGGIRSVRLISRIRPDSMAHESYILKLGYDFTAKAPSEPVQVFSGTAGEAARAFPRHFNAAVSLSLGGIGLDRTMVDVWVDPEVPGAIHQVDVDGEDIGLMLISRNRPSANPRTSRIVAPSILAALRGLTAPLTVGS